MPGEGASVTVPLRDDQVRRTPFGIALNLVGMAVVTVYFVPQILSGTITGAPVIVPLGWIAIAAWLASIVVPAGRVRVLAVVYLVMVLCGAPGAWPTNGLLIVPVVAGVLLTTAGGNPPWLTWVYALAAAGLVLIVPIAVAVQGGKGVTVEGILSIEFAILIGLLGGVNRRQARARQRAASELVERTAAMREEQAKASALAMRQGLARDLHDVLAHSLGGLVIQLDAVEAQLEAGKTDAALGRLHDARAMAASGLAEARRAVEALRAEPEEQASVPHADLAAGLIDLVDVHERLGGRVEFEQLGAPRDVPDAVSTALRRALQESLSNARKHAPGEPVTVRIQWRDDRVELDVSNPLPPVAHVSSGTGAAANATPPLNTSTSTTSLTLAASGAGHGLTGMRERFAELPGGEVDAGPHGDEFAVHASASLESA